MYVCVMSVALHRCFFIVLDIGMVLLFFGKVEFSEGQFVEFCKFG